jgi:hypothetical protein
MSEAFDKFFRDHITFETEIFMPFAIELFPYFTAEIEPLAQKSRLNLWHCRATRSRDIWRVGRPCKPPDELVNSIEARTFEDPAISDESFLLEVSEQFGVSRSPTGATVIRNFLRHKCQRICHDHASEGG